jgi:DNA-binding transcriptional regulator PaaX
VSHWLLLTYRLPSGESRERVAVWREVRRSGALHLQQSVVAFPDVESFRKAVERLRTAVSELGGHTLVLRGEPLAEPDRERLEQAWEEARSAEYGELISECEKYLVEIEHEFEIEKFTLAELDEEEAELEKLKAWHGRIAARDVHDCDRGGDAAAALERGAEALSRYTVAVFERTQG